MDIKGCAAVVTGGASGLGAAAAQTLAEAGAQVAVMDVNAEKGEAVARAIGGRFISVDVRERASVEAAFADAAAAHGPARILICCAGVVDAQKLVHKGQAHSAERFERVIAINLIGVFHCMAVAAEAMAQLPPLEDGERGVIVNTASVAAYDGQMGQIAYSASKAAIAGMCLPAARDMAGHGVRVCAIAPGVFETAMVEGLPEAVREALHASVPFPSRMGRPEEFAALARHICENPMLNGETIRLDGALRMSAR